MLVVDAPKNSVDLCDVGLERAQLFKILLRFFQVTGGKSCLSLFCILSGSSVASELWEKAGLKTNGQVSNNPVQSLRERDMDGVYSAKR